EAHVAGRQREGVGGGVEDGGVAARALLAGLGAEGRLLAGEAGEQQEQGDRAARRHGYSSRLRVISRTAATSAMLAVWALRAAMPSATALRSGLPSAAWIA